MIWLILLAWFVIGVVAVYFGKESGGWLIMMADDRSNVWPWTAFVALLLCWLLWPIQTKVARTCFQVTWYVINPIVTSRRNRTEGDGSQ